MAVKFYGVNDPMAVKLWSKKLFVDAISNTWIDRFVGEGTDKVIQRLMPRNKGAGDQITYGLRARLAGDGKQGHEKLEGNEEALSINTDSFVINKLRHAVRVAGSGSISQERVPFNVRDEARAGLSDWWAERMDYSAAIQLTGSPFRYNNDTSLWTTSGGDTRFSGNNAVLSPDADHFMLANPAAANEAALTNAATDYFTLGVLDRAVAKAKTSQPRVRPIRMNGSDVYVAFLHPLHVLQLRTSAGSQWVDIQKAMLQGGQGNENGLLSGALGMYGGVILHEWDKLPPGVAANGTPLTNVRRSVLCGAQAAAIGFGSGEGGGNATDAFNWVEELYDYEDELGVAAGGIFGLKKTRFGGKDFGTIVMSSYTPPVV